MRNTLITTAAALALIVGTATTFAAEANKNNADQSQAQSQASKSDSSAVQKNCADILANRAGHSASEIAECQKQ